MTQGGNRTARKIFYDQQTFVDSEEARKALSSSVDMEAVLLNDVQHPPMTMVDPPMSLDVQASMQALQYDWHVVTGTTGHRMGTAEEAQTATAVAVTEKGATLRDSDQQVLVERWMSVAGTKMHQLVRQTMTLDMYVLMKGFGDKELGELLQTPGFQELLTQAYGEKLAAAFPQLLQSMPALQQKLKTQFGKEHFLRVSREDLNFECQIRVVPTSMRSRSLASDRQTWLEFLAVIGQYPQLMQSRALLEETAAKFDFLSEAAIDEIYLQAQRQMQQQAQAQQAAMEAQQAKTQMDLAKVAMAHPAGAQAVAHAVQGAQPSQANGQLPPMSRESL